MLCVLKEKELLCLRMVMKSKIDFCFILRLVDCGLASDIGEKVIVLRRVVEKVVVS